MTALLIANTQIRCDAAGRFCLNDLHQASGGEARHRPGRWLDTDKTRELIECIAAGDETAGIPAVSEPLATLEGRLGGTYAVKELVYAYAMWISAAFHLHVIRAYDAMVTAQRADITPPLPLAPQHRADQFVSAARIFGAAMRTARTLRLSPAKAIRAAMDCAARHTGIQLAEELALQGTEVEFGPAQAMADVIATAVAGWVPGKTLFSTADAIVGAELGDAFDRAMQMRVSDVLRSLGYSKQRINRKWLWRSPAEVIDKR